MVVFAAVVICFAQTQYNVSEGSTAQLLVERVGDIAYPISVDVRTIDGTATGV